MVSRLSSATPLNINPPIQPEPTLEAVPVKAG